MLPHRIRNVQSDVDPVADSTDPCAKLAPAGLSARQDEEISITDLNPS